ncbi:unnamed protein product [Nesidiocoris tenuis]|uniref:Uncharacterized protein n=1 Tax=Nesidiocoris tenuis TaxID=355587 RepID=A0A6H5HW08_9HEMI|nr:unnamed protein product [Nesidiocoris tenuis]
MTSGAALPPLRLSNNNINSHKVARYGYLRSHAGTFLNNSLAFIHVLQHQQSTSAGACRSHEVNCLRLALVYNHLTYHRGRHVNKQLVLSHPHGQQHRRPPSLTLSSPTRELRIPTAAPTPEGLSAFCILYLFHGKTAGPPPLPRPPSFIYLNYCDYRESLTE